MEELQIKVKLTEKDYRRFCFIYIFKLSRNAIFLFVLFIISFSEAIKSFSIGVSILISLAIASVVMSVSCLIRYISVFSFSKKIYKQNSAMQFETTYIFSEEKIIEENEKMKNNYFYEEIKKMKKTKKLLAVYNTDINAMIIPINDGNRDTVEKIYAFLREKCPNAKKIF